jgi:hypothetical protein
MSIPLESSGMSCINGHFVLFGAGKFIVLNTHTGRNIEIKFDELINMFIMLGDLYTIPRHLQPVSSLINVMYDHRYGEFMDYLAHKKICRDVRLLIKSFLVDANYNGQLDESLNANRTQDRV